MTCGRPKYALLLAGMALLAGLWGGGTGQSSEPLPFPSDSAPSLGDVLKAVEKKYNGMKTMKAHFRQIYRQGSRVRQEQGVLYLSKPGRMRWEYEKPEPKLFVTDGKQVILFVPSENRVTQSAIKESDDIRAPLRFLLGRLQFREEFDKIETSPQLVPVERGGFVFKAYSKKLADRLDWILFEVSPSSEIRRVVTHEAGGLETEFQFDGLESNPPLADSTFRFSPPAGAEVVK